MHVENHARINNLAFNHFEFHLNIMIKLKFVGQLRAQLKCKNSEPMIKMSLSLVKLHEIKSLKAIIGTIKKDSKNRGTIEIFQS